MEQAENARDWGELEVAKSFFVQAGKLTTNDLPYYELAALGPFEDWSLEAAEEAVKRNPYSARNRLLLAQIQFREKRFEEARIHAEESHRLYPLEPKTAKLLVDIYRKLGWSERSLEMTLEWTRLKDLRRSTR